MKRTLFLLFMGLGVALAALLLATPVHAQDLGPDPAAAPVAEPSAEPPAGSIPEAEVPASPALEAPAEAPVDVLPTVAAPDAPAQAPVEEVPAGGLEALSETGVVLADESGAALPAAAGGDPYFTVGATTYRFMLDVGPADECAGIPFCISSLTPISDAIEKVADGFIPNDRRIYVEAGTYYEDVDIDATLPGNAPLAQLMGLIGGVSAPVDPFNTGDPNRTIDGHVEVRGSALGFTLEGFNINGYVWLDGVAGSVTLKNLNVDGSVYGSDGIYVEYGNGPVTLDHVDSSNHDSPGLAIYNPDSFGGVTISNSRFDRNDDPADVNDFNGLSVTTKGLISLSGVSANYNGGTGAWLLSKNSSITVRSSAMSGNVTSTGDLGWGYGLEAYSALGTTVDMLVADNNERSGFRTTTNGTVTLSNIRAGENGLDGIDVAAPDDENDPWGTWKLAGGSVVTMTNIDVDYNSRHGVLVVANNAITITTIDAYRNDDTGAFLNNCRWNGTACLGIGNIMVTNGSFYGDYVQEFGIWAESRGSILLTNVQADQNNQEGAHLNNWWTGAYGIITISGLPTRDASFSGNGSTGLTAWSKQSITLNYVDASWNGTLGADLENNATGSAGAVTISDSGFYGNQETGLDVDSNGAISLYRSGANSNGQGGAGDGASLDNSGAAYPMPVTVNTAWFWENANGSGLRVASKGYISLYGVGAGNNGEDGLSLDNQYTGAFSGISIIGSNTGPIDTYSNLYHNGQNGARLTTNGAVSLLNSNLDENGGYGLDVNTGTSPYGSLTLTNVNMNNNQKNGLWAETRGVVTWTNGRANGNGHNNGLIMGFGGVYIDNAGGSYPMPVTLTNIEIRDSHNEGLGVLSLGAITLGNATIENNGSMGAYLVNDLGTASMVNIYNASLNNNVGTNLIITSRGYILLSNVSARNSAIGGGIDLDNSAAIYGLGVTLSRVDANDNRGGSGLEIDTKGYVSLADVSGSNNTGSGADIDNSSGYAAGLTFTSGYYGNAFSNNQGDGFRLLSSGAVTIFNLDASNNGGSGLVVNNQFSYSGPVTIYGTLPGWRNGYSDNWASGLVVNTWSVITLYNVAAERNGYMGALLDNQDATYPMPVSITNGWFSENQNGDGLAVYSRGAVTLSSIDSERNSVDWGGTAYFGETYRDQLARWDSEGDTWWVQLTSPTVLSISMDLISGGIDPYLRLYDDYDNLLAEDGDSGGGLNALITTGVLGTGWYRIQAMQNDFARTGEYLLDINGDKSLDRTPARNVYVNNQGTWNGTAWNGSGAVTLNGSYLDWNYISHAAGNGVEIETNGGVNMNYVESDQNGLYGFLITDYSLMPSTWSNVRANENPQDGVRDWTRGSFFSLYKGEFNRNGGWGLYLDGSTGSAYSFTSLTGVQANENYSDNLYLLTRGPVTMVTIEASRSQTGYGAYIDNRTPANGYVNLLGSYNQFDSNFKTNLQVHTNGSILLMNTDGTYSKNGHGALLDTTGGIGSVTITGAFPWPGWYSGFDRNNGSGLVIGSRGLVSLFNVGASENGDTGASIDNSTANLAPSPVIITQSQFNGNLDGDGLDIATRGQVTLTGVQANGNNGDGANIDNATNAWSVPQGVSVFNSVFIGNYNGSGLWVDTRGSVLGYTVNASFNTGYGAHITNNYDGSLGTVTLLGIYGENVLDGNGETNLWIQSRKTVTLGNVSANWSHNGDGVQIYNYGTVSVTSSRFNNNAGHGLNIDPLGLVTLSYLNAISNGQAADGDGIHVKSYGYNVMLMFSTVTANFGNGIEVDHDSGSLTLIAVNYLGNDVNMNEFPNSQDNLNSYG